MSTFFNNLESYGLFLIYKMLIWTSRNIPNVGLFSDYAEVFLELQVRSHVGIAFLCLRRGVSNRHQSRCRAFSFSLPTQRCFPCRRLETPHSGSFLCLRRGVSDFGPSGPRACTFSLPTQRCFYIEAVRPDLDPLFSAYAEVFLEFARFTPGNVTFLCLRRGVSF